VEKPFKSLPASFFYREEAGFPLWQRRIEEGFSPLARENESILTLFQSAKQVCEKKFLTSILVA
jgi:hypothetical protein